MAGLAVRQEQGTSSHQVVELLSCAVCRMQRWPWSLNWNDARVLGQSMQTHSLGQSCQTT